MAEMGRSMLDRFRYPNHLSLGIANPNLSTSNKPKKDEKDERVENDTRVIDCVLLLT
jgi:hypothetical protein